MSSRLTVTPDRIVAGHPWIYHGSVLRLTQNVSDGELVQVKDHRQRFLGVGFYNSKSKINVRVLSPERVEVDQAFFEGRIAAALAVRRKHLPEATSFRLEPCSTRWRPEPCHSVAKVLA